MCFFDMAKQCRCQDTDDTWEHTDGITAQTTSQARIEEFVSIVAL